MAENAHLEDTKPGWRPMVRRGVAACILGATALASVIPVTALAQSSSPFSGLFSGWFSRGTPEPEPTPPADAQIQNNVALRFLFTSGEDELEKPVRGASLLIGALQENRTTGQDILAAARADYARVLGVMFDQGYFSAVINILVDGVEAVEIAPLDAPFSISQVDVLIDPGPRFTFGRAGLAPLVPGTTPIDAYQVGEWARTGVIKSATTTAIRDWRDHGMAKARVAGQEIIADHDKSTLESSVTLDPGPAVTFGKLHVTGYERMNPRRLQKIAGFPEGERFSPESLDDVRKRLRRAGVFSAITLVEADQLNPDDSLDIGLTVVEQKPRRIGGGVEISNVDGASVSAYWLHRNLLGGAERFRVDGRISDISADGDGRDYSLGLRIDRPATINADTTAYVELAVESDNEPAYDSDRLTAGFGLTYLKSDELTLNGALQYRYERVRDSDGERRFRLLAAPLSATLDRRDNPTDARSGYWLSGTATPFLGLDSQTGSGAQMLTEARIYRSPSESSRLTFAGRARLGTVLGPEIAQTPRDYLFWSGGGGSVRGHPYESLGVESIEGSNGPVRTGGMSLATLSAEARFQVREKIGVVGFVDAGQVWTEDLWQGESGAHIGAGVGVRYATPIGPIRFDVAGPVSGDTGEGVQIYLGLGQAF